MESTAKLPEAERHSTRIRVQIPLRITSLDPAFPMSESCHTLVLNTQGCGVRLLRPLRPGVPVRLHELPGGHTATARVANCVPLGTGSDYWLVGLELERPGNIWGIHPAPTDWGKPEPAVGAAARSAPRKKGEWPYAQFSDQGEFHPGRK